MAERSSKSIAEIQAALDGPVASLPVSFTASGEVDWQGVRNMIDISIAGGCRVSLLTFGDSQFDQLSDEEHLQLTRVLVEHSNGRSLTVAANRRWPLRKNLEYAAFCRDLGVDLLMCLQIDVLMVPRPDTDVAGYYKSIAQHMPVMLMGWPALSLVDTLLDEPRICAFKEDGSMDYGIDANRRYGKRLKIMAGGGLGRHYAYWPYGCRAFMSIWPALKPELDQRYWQALQAGDHLTALRLVQQNWDIFDASNAYPGGWQTFWRGWLELAGVAQRYLRAPLRSMTDTEMERLKGDLTRLGAL